ncbi:GntR family transcriptional regulator [Glutamicibacter sp. NPDC087344]|uniref:GntR family transcriptional regulator n=1 Tax=Glutamicibacter sp. NPDC087344 TaxID=3363994 RepID=UPI00382569C0
MELEVDTRSPVPSYEQIRHQITKLVLTGVLQPGIQLPPIRRLAGHLGLSNGVVARAYKELEREGTVISEGKKGTTIAPRRIPADSGNQNHERDQLLLEGAVKYAALAHSLGFGAPDAQDALKRALDPNFLGAPGSGILDQIVDQVGPTLRRTTSPI